MSDLTIKVSEEKVRETITIMDNKINIMEDRLAQIVNEREKLERSYKGNLAADLAAKAVKKSEDQVRTSIKKYKDQKEKLQQYLDTMNEADSKAIKDFEEALNKTNELFG